MNTEERAIDAPIENRNRIALAYLYMAREKKFLRLSENDRVQLIRRALSFADSAARGVISEFKTNEPRKIASMLGLQIIGDDGGMNGSMLKRSELRPGAKEIIIYRDSLNKLMNEVSTLDLSDRIMKMLIAHEIFHYLEHTRFGKSSRRVKHLRWKFGPFSSSVKFRMISEVCAHAFAETLLEISQSPMVFDYLTYILHSSRGRC